MRKKKPSIRVEDGTIMGGADGQLWSVFVPRWWQFWRWAEWYLPFWRGERGRVTVSFEVGDEQPVEVELRLRRYLDPHTGKPRVLPNVPSADARHVIEER